MGERPPMRQRRINARHVVAMTIIASFSGCGGAPELAPTSNLILASLENPFADVDPALQSNVVPIIYATDRDRSYDEDGRLQYGYHRSKSLAVGVCRVQIGEDISWDDLVAESRTAVRSRDLTLSIDSMEELLRFPSTPAPPVNLNGQLKPDPVAVRASKNVQTVFQSLLRERLARASRKEVFLFVHGYNNTLEDAALRWAQLWHFMGRQGVPIVYSWPAGRGGLRGYTYDRESGEFTIYHLKQFLTELAACPDVEKVHILAHSRGTDVLTTALRELNERHSSSAQGTRAALKLGQLVLAAADLDWDVMTQRISAEGLMFIPETLTIYISKEDKALGLAQWLFDSVRRIGDLLVTDLSSQQVALLEATSQLTVVDVQGETGFMGHGYFISTMPSCRISFSCCATGVFRARRTAGRSLAPVERSGCWMTGICVSSDRNQRPSNSPPTTQDCTSMPRTPSWRLVSRGAVVRERPGDVGLGIVRYTPDLF